LVNGAGKPIQLIGFSHSGSEYACVQGWGIFDGPTSNAAIQYMRSWAPRMVRVPLNEDCWLAINGVKLAYSGANYRTAIAGYVHRLNAAGLYVDLDLHWNAPGHNRATGQQVMADADHSIVFWQSVARYFKSNPAVAFELYNEPHDISWPCWLSGCRVSGGWRTAGMAQLVNAVRSVGARNVVLVGGLGWSNDVSQWLRYRPHDPVNQLGAVVHMYNFNGCVNPSCWNATIAPVARHVPVVTTELGENDCNGWFVTEYMHWADRARVSYLAWTWNTWDCRSGPALITSYNGSATPYGAAVKAHFLGR
jgi:hypothetical protein